MKMIIDVNEIGKIIAEDVFKRMKLVQETVDCIRYTFNHDTESHKLVRNCMALVQNAIDGEYHDMEEVDVSKLERAEGKWIPVSERLPEDEKEVLIHYGQSIMVGYHIFDHTIYPFGYEDENETGWYNSKDDFICGSNEVVAWMPLPEPYKEN